MKFDFQNAKAFYVDSNGKVPIPVEVQQTFLNIYEGEKYQGTVKVRSSRNYNNLGFDLVWNDANVIPNMNGLALEFTGGTLFDRADYDLVANPFLDENRIYVAISLKPGAVWNTVGEFSVIHFIFGLKTVDDKLYLFIEFTKV